LKESQTPSNAATNQTTRNKLIGIHVALLQVFKSCPDLAGFTAAQWMLNLRLPGNLNFTLTISRSVDQCPARVFRIKVSLRRIDETGNSALYSQINEHSGKGRRFEPGYHSDL